eukprot:GHVN01048072.1.p1 GENE.GHVN01048072.1~~GHVN01048072.1.p1  ORF type:complete len:115 (+),score=55.84 GHVN01048072.1:3-347(+)
MSEVPLVSAAVSWLEALTSFCTFTPFTSSITQLCHPSAHTNRNHLTNASTHTHHTHLTHPSTLTHQTHRTDSPPHSPLYSHSPQPSLTLYSHSPNLPHSPFYSHPPEEEIVCYL